MIELCAMNGHWRFYQLEDCFSSLSKQGFRNVELWTGPMHCFVDYQKEADAERVLQLAKKYSLNIVAICPEQTNPKPNNIASPDRKDDIFAYYQNILKFAYACGAKKVTVTSGWMYFNESKPEAWERSVQMMRRIATEAKRYGIALVMEALQPDESRLVNTSLELKKYIEDVGLDNMRVCIDFGAMARACETIDDYFENCGDYIEHVHFVDGSPTGHLAYSDGTRDVIEDIKVLHHYGYQGYLSCESVASRYFEEPWIADQKNYESFKKGIGELK